MTAAGLTLTKGPKRPHQPPPHGERVRTGASFSRSALLGLHHGALGLTQAQTFGGRIALRVSGAQESADAALACADLFDGETRLMWRGRPSLSLCRIPAVRAASVAGASHERA